METSANITSFATVPSGVGDAVGVPNRKWYVAIVGNNTEKVCAEKLKKAGYTYYLPTQEEVKIWKNGKKAKTDKVLIPAKIFVHCTEKERKEIVSLPFIKKFMTNVMRRKDEFGKNPLAIIPNHQIETLKFILGHSDTPVNISQEMLRTGDRVRVVRGKLKGIEGSIEIVDTNHGNLVITLDCFGYARLHIDLVNVEHI